MSIATTKGPPANPNLTGVGTPGIINGMLPKMIPNNIPTKMVAMLGWSSFLSEFPSTSATRLTASCSPTTITRSPT